MNRKEVEKSFALKRRFVKDCGIPITVFESPYFEERLDILDPIYETKSKFKRFCKGLKAFASEQEYFESYNTIKESIIEYIRGRDGYKNFCAETAKNIISDYEKKSLFSDGNDNKAFISIDMKKANFSSMNYYDPSIFEAGTWEEFVSRFTDNEHIINSKYIRQVIMGACNPKKQISYEKQLTSKLCDHIVNIFDEIKIYSVGEDEIIIPVNNNISFSLKQLKAAISESPVGHLFKVEVFDLYRLGSYGWYKDIYGDNEKVEFKCIDTEIVHQIIKYLYGEEITENDLVFENKGKLAKYLECIDNPW